MNRADSESDDEIDKKTFSDPRARPHEARGQPVEFALVLNLALMMLLGVFEYAQILMVHNMMSAAGDIAARKASSGTSKLTTADLTQVVKQLVTFNRLTNLTVQIYVCNSSGSADATIPNWTDAPFGTGIAVQVDADFPALVPKLGILPNPTHLRTKSISCSEAS